MRPIPGQERFVPCSEYAVVLRSGRPRRAASPLEHLKPEASRLSFSVSLLVSYRPVGAPQVDRAAVAALVLETVRLVRLPVTHPEGVRHDP